MQELKRIAPELALTTAYNRNYVPALRRLLYIPIDNINKPDSLPFVNLGVSDMSLNAFVCGADNSVADKDFFQ